MYVANVEVFLGNILQKYVRLGLCIEESFDTTTIWDFFWGGGGGIHPYPPGRVVPKNAGPERVISLPDKNLKLCKYILLSNKNYTP